MEERIYYVYEYVRLDNNSVFYVGKGKGRRINKLNNRAKHFINIINKIPTACYIVEDNLTEDEAHQLECFLIHQYVFEEGYSIDIQGIKKNSDKFHLVNKTWGGEGVSCIKSEEWKRKFTESMNKPETKKKISDAHKGKTLSEEIKRKLSKSLKIAMNKPETKKKLSESLKGRKVSEETKNKLKKSCKISSKIWYNSLDEKTKKEYLRKSKEATILKMKEPEVRKKMSEAGMGTKNNRSKGGVYIIHKKQIKFYENLKEASKEFEISTATLSQLANSKKEYFSKKDEKKHLNGLTCIYGNDYKLLEI